MKLWRRIRYWWDRDRAAAELAEEIELHRAERQAALERGGLGQEEAAAASRRALGNVTLAREDARAVWAWTAFDLLCGGTSGMRCGRCAGSPPWASLQSSRSARASPSRLSLSASPNPSCGSRCRLPTRTVWSAWSEPSRTGRNRARPLTARTIARGEQKRRIRGRRGIPME